MHQDSRLGAIVRPLPIFVKKILVINRRKVQPDLALARQNQLHLRAVIEMVDGVAGNPLASGKLLRANFIQPRKHLQQPPSPLLRPQRCRPHSLILAAVNEGRLVRIELHHPPHWPAPTLHIVVDVEMPAIRNRTAQRVRHTQFVIPTMLVRPISLHQRDRRLPRFHRQKSVRNLRTRVGSFFSAAASTNRRASSAVGLSFFGTVNSPAVIASLSVSSGPNRVNHG